MIDEAQKVSVLLAEYNTLRAEVMAARGATTQAVSLMLPVVLAMAGYHFSDHPALPGWVSAGLFSLGIVYIVAALGWNEFNTRHFKARLRFLEDDINRREGETLLVWESQGWKGMIWP
jgi:membrane protein YdbS with pleckstrin-like domain